MLYDGENLLTTTRRRDGLKRWIDTIGPVGYLKQDSNRTFPPGSRYDGFEKA